MFDTWGPYTCKTYDKAGIDDLWVQFRANPTASVENGVGVYLVGVLDGDNFMPWYVGQTYTSFGNRLRQHFDSGRFEAIAHKGPLNFVLIARTKDGTIIPRQSGAKARLDRKAINWLEVDLIGKSFEINRHLLNRQHVRFLRSIWVGGYRGDGALDAKEIASYPAYSLLAKLFKLI